jgi:antitoxin CptB
MNRDDRLKKLRFRAWHRGTKEADLMIGGFFDSFAAGWDEAELDWFEALLEIDDVLIMAWATGNEPVPPEVEHPLMRRMQQLDYIPIAK